MMELLKNHSKKMVFLLCLIPLLWYVVALLLDELGANPIEAITRGTGDWALRFLLITLTITPLRKLFGWASLMRYRRMLGLFTFFYAFLHLVTYLWLDQFFDWAEIFNDIMERPFITVGFIAFLILLPLAMTSTNAMMRRLKRNWVRLHQWVYVCVTLAVLHFWWMRASKGDLLEPIIYSLILLFLFSVRLKYYFDKQSRQKASLAQKTG